MMQVSPELQALAQQIEDEEKIPVELINTPDFYTYSHNTGEPIVASLQK